MSANEINHSSPGSAGANAIASVEARPASKARPNWANWGLLLALLGVLVYMQWRGSFAPRPPVFDEGLSLEQGVERAGEQGKLVIAYGSASWCGPCQTYKSTTLVDDGVVAWIRRHAEPVYVNIDRQQMEAQQLGIASIPVTILLKDGKEVARLTGAASAEEFMEWVRPWTPLVRN
ncbi:MAG: thioredoxin family protein [Phycisphaerales bacterium]|nr:thioredoxin family protein [Phycisphaerales bacterium]